MGAKLIQKSRQRQSRRGCRVSIPASYQHASLRAVLPADENGDRAIAFDVQDGGIQRIRISSEDAIHLAENLTRQSEDHSEGAAGISSEPTPSRLAAVNTDSPVLHAMEGPHVHQGFYDGLGERYVTLDFGNLRMICTDAAAMERLAEKMAAYTHWLRDGEHPAGSTPACRRSIIVNPPTIGIAPVADWFRFRCACLGYQHSIPLLKLRYFLRMRLLKLRYLRRMSLLKARYFLRMPLFLLLPPSAETPLEDAPNRRPDGKQGGQDTK
jgi:hypothetical protein